MAQEVVELVEDTLDTHLVAVGNNVATIFPTPAGGVQPREIHIQAPLGNALNIVIGTSNVLSNLSHGGWEIPPGANFILPMCAWKKLYCIANGAAQKLLVNYVWGAS